MVGEAVSNTLAETAGALEAEGRTVHHVTMETVLDEATGWTDSRPVDYWYVSKANPARYKLYTKFDGLPCVEIPAAYCWGSVA